MSMLLLPYDKKFPKIAKVNFSIKTKTNFMDAININSHYDTVPNFALAFNYHTNFFNFSNSQQS